MWRRVLSEKNLASAYEKVRPVIMADLASNLKEQVFTLLEDEEVASMLSDYGDAFVKGRMQTFWGSVGGRQRGLNYALAEVNPLDNLVTDEGGINLAGIIRMLLSGGFKGMGEGGRGATTSSSRPISASDTRVQV